MPTQTHKPRVGDSYFERIRRFPLVPLRSSRDLRAAQAVIDELLKDGRLDSSERAYLEVLGDLVMAYEDEHHPIPRASDADLLRHLIEAQKTSQAEVARRTGIARSTLSEILSGKRPVSRSHIAPLARVFGVDPGVFVRTDD